VSWWDYFKDMVGVLCTFVDYLFDFLDDVYFVFVGLDVVGVSDDLEGV